jgi:type IV secretory pathway TraG/TraD family ATPase VirD4
MDLKQAALVLPFSHRHDAVLNPINSLLLKRLTDELVHRNDPRSYTVVALDEFGTLRADLSKLFLMGRGAGGIPVVALQDVGVLFTDHGESKAHSMLALLQNRVYLKTEGTVTPAYQSETVGTQDNVLIPPDQNLHGARIESRRLVTASEFLSLPLADWEGDCIEGYAKILGIGQFPTRYGFRKVIDHLNSLPSPASVVGRPDEDLKLSPFTKEEKFLLGLI